MQLPWEQPALPKRFLCRFLGWREGQPGVLLPIAAISEGVSVEDAVLGLYANHHRIANLRVHCVFDDLPAGSRRQCRAAYPDASSGDGYWYPVDQMPETGRLGPSDIHMD